MWSSSVGVASLLLSCANLSPCSRVSLFHMAASPDLRGSSPPVELELRAVSILPPAEDRGRRMSSSPEAEAEADEGGGGECHTPASMESKIAAITSCPPAPKKARRTLAPCKRRLSDLELFSVGPELMCRLFRPLDAPRFVCFPPAPATKKRKLYYPNEE